MTNKQVIDGLVAELRAASDAYYNTDKPIMSDAEFDAKKDFNN